MDYGKVPTLDNQLARSYRNKGRVPHICPVLADVGYQGSRSLRHRGAPLLPR